MAITVIKKPLETKNQKEHETALEKTNLFFSGRIRWNIFITVLIISFIVVPFFVPIYVSFALNSYFLLFWLVYTVFNVYRHIKISRAVKKYHNSDKNLKTISEKVDNKYNYIMATFAYKEPIDMIIKCLQNILNINGYENVIMSICLEEKTPDLDKKIEKLTKDYDFKFAELIITVHPYGIEGEIPGKCSNSNYGIRSIYNHLKDKNSNFKPEDYILVNFDIDTVFHKHFLDELKETVNKEKDISQVIYQPLLYYNWNLDKLTFYTRLIGILRSKMMAGALTTFNINVMSVFCASLKLYVDGDFVHPFYQMDDIICYIRFMIVTQRRLKIKPLYSPTLSGPTSGENWREELKELCIQGVRWTIGSAEVFHYFMCKLRRIKFLDALIWGFNYLNYYFFILCIQGLFTISSTIRLFVIKDYDDIFQYLFLIFPYLSYVFNLIMMIVNKVAVDTFLKEIGVEENFHILRDILHWILSVPTNILYSFVTLYGFVSIMIRGKEVCKHRASNKDNLV